MAKPSTEDQLNGFIAKYTPEIATQAHEVLAKMRARLPGAIQLVYDNYNALAIGFSATERSSDAIFSIAVFPRWVSLFFLQQGPALPDPHKLLQGTGTKVRHIVLEGAHTLERPAVKALMKEALKRAPKPLDPAQPGRLVVKSVSAKQRPRRPR
jgi:hypothetical protein